MLKFVVTMVWVLFAAAEPHSTILHQEQESADRIASPGPGEPIQGIVPVVGSIPAEDVFSAVLFFGYSESPVETWFPITVIPGPIEDGLLVEWDTSLLTDGDYTLRLVITLSDGSKEITLVEGLRIRNYSPVETATPTPVPSQTPRPTADPLQFTETPTPTDAPPTQTPTPLPANPARLSGGSILNALLRGAAGTLAIFLILGLYLTLARAIRR